MLFTSITFWAVFTAFLLFFALFRRSTKKGMMLYVVAFSLLFYYLNSGLLMVVLPAVALVTYYGTRRMADLEGRDRLRTMWAVIIIDLLPLLYFKYTPLAVDIWNAILRSNFSLGTIIVPAGVSFFTFQAISYVVDVYKGKFQDEVSPLEFFFYLTFFPLLLAGPITRPETFFSNFRDDRTDDEGRLLPVDRTLLYTGLWLIMLGLVKKLVVADYIAQYNNWVFDDPTTFSGFENLMGVLGYTVQIYCDFSGYSDISIGMAALMGVSLPENFNQPYQSLNITEFWRRWHISLSTWFRDYFYIPLGGNRKGKARTYLNNFLTMVLAGIWHGSTPMFALWGAIHGLGLVVHKFSKRWLDRIPNVWYTKPVAWLVTFCFVMGTWVFFRASSLDVCWQIFGKVFCEMDLAYVPPFLAARPLWTFLVVGSMLLHAVRRNYHHHLISWYVDTPLPVKVIMFGVVVQLCVQMHTSNVQPFIYYQF